MPNTYTELRSTTVGTATNTVTFDLTGISGYTDLVLVANYTNAGTANSTKFWVNGDTGSNYSVTGMGGDGSAARSWRASNQAFIKPDDTNGASSTIATAIYNFQNYSNSTTYKTIIGRTNNTQYGLDAFVGLWRNTNAITSISLAIINGANWAVGSTFSLYGIANADQGAAKATGGIITEDSQYWYHTFGASGAFVPKQSLTCDVLVVAGGGSGGSNQGAGGGAGGLLGFTSQALTATSYNITVGGGGAGVSGVNNGVNGNDSQFQGLTLVKGGGGGGSYQNTASGLTGGSGGGATPNSSGTLAGALGTTSQGNQGGSGSTDNATYRSSGGGGGAGAVGGNGSTSAPNIGGAGGVGLATYSSWGLAAGVGQNVSGTVYFAGGGGGQGNTNGAGGFGGGTPGARDVASLSAAANTGGGSGGGGNAAGAGGSGVVIIRYSK